MPPRERPARGSTPAGFRDQLLQRLQTRARQEQVTVQRLQSRVAFERFLARIADDCGEWVLKGGFALELRCRDPPCQLPYLPADAAPRRKTARLHLPAHVSECPNKGFG